MPKIISKSKDDLEVVSQLSFFVGHALQFVPLLEKRCVNIQILKYQISYFKVSNLLFSQDLKDMS